jgi:carbon-monoxide dehydrogenase large subunit
MDYALPRADDLPLFQTEISEVPSTTNPLGMRGGSPASVADAAGRRASKSAPVAPEGGITRPINYPR